MHLSPIIKGIKDTCYRHPIIGENFVSHTKRRDRPREERSIHVQLPR